MDMSMSEDDINAAAALSGDAGPKGNGNGNPTPADVAKNISGPHPVHTSGPLKPVRQTEGPVSTLMRAQKEFIRHQQKYIHDQQLGGMISSQVDYITALVAVLHGIGPSTQGELAAAQEIYIEALTNALERLGLL